MSLPQHISGSTELYTPEPVVVFSRSLMGRIDLDPASSWLGNEVVQAARYYGLRRSPDGTRSSDALDRPWHARSVFLNPPGGAAPAKNIAKTRSSACMWWHRLVTEWEAGRVGEAVFLGFTLEIQSATQRLNDVPSVMAFPQVILSRRLQFDVPRPVVLDDGSVLRDVQVPEGRKVRRVRTDAKRVATSDASHANVLVYLPPFAKNRRKRLPWPTWWASGIGKRVERRLERMIALAEQLGEPKL